MQTSKFGAGTILRFLIHLIMLLIFMGIADTIMRATMERAAAWVPLAFNAGGALVYALLVLIFRFFIRSLRR